MSKFNIRKFLTENKLTVTSKRLDEASYKIYHKSATDAAQTAKEYAEKQGYEVNEDDWHSEVATGGRNRRLRPSEGKTNKFSVRLNTKSGKETRKMLHFQLYGMESGKYELNAYIT